MEQIKKINKLENLSGFLAGKKVFLRADFNVPVRDGVVADSYRIESIVPTLEFLKKEKAIVIIASHIETKDVEKPTLKPVFDYIKEKYPEFDFAFCEDFLNSEVMASAVAERKEGTFLLLENIRNANESGFSEKDNSVSLAMYFKDFVEVYINDAFAVAHRAHMSVSALPKLFDASKKAAGFLLSKEIDGLLCGIDATRPCVAILSGVKFSTKLPLIQKYLNSADMLFIGGALFNNVVKSMGYEVGVSIVDSEANDLDALVRIENFQKKVYIPNVVVIKDMTTGAVRSDSLTTVKQTESIQDISGLAISNFINEVKSLQAKTIIWNGPIGNYDVPEFAVGTKELATALLEYIQSHVDARMLIGGGDTVAAIEEIPGIQTEERIFVSTGGGAMLEFLEKDGHLPGIMSLL